jgi:hypothetical protein
VKRAVVIALAIGAAAVACGTSSYPFQARRFDPTLMCLDPYTGIDVISGDDPGGGCTLACLANAGTYYLTQECPPYPPLFAVYSADAGSAASDPTCAAAIAAYTRGATCDLDGGVIYPDGGADAEAGAHDAAPEAGDAADASDAAPEASDAASEASDAASEASDAAPEASDAASD